MQLILYSKNSADSGKPRIVNLNASPDKKLIEGNLHQGIICLTSEVIYESHRKDFEKAGYHECGIKGKSINLKRALGFDKIRDRQLPKKLTFNTTNLGAFKRGLNTFLTRYYTSADPACMIVIPQTLLDALIRDAGKETITKRMHGAINESDPLFQLLNIAESDPKMIRLKEIYIGDSLKVQHARALIYRASETDSPVLILGESGTGKDVIANQIFENSSAYTADFFRVNCSALPETLFESELFGYKQGIFTGANKNKIGLFTAAVKGTIFLDEIGDLSLANQVKILHAVEKKEIRQVGSNKTHPIDVRIIAATNRNLDAMMRQGTFREDLYYRISTFRITASPLREHPEDIPLLAKAHWNRRSRHGYLSSEFLDYLKNYQWPGNVRELFTMLNSVVDYFGDISPTPAHIEAIRKSRQEILTQSINNSDDPAQILKIKSQNTLITVQNILRSIKIEMRPVINHQVEQKDITHLAEHLKNFISQQITILNKLCLEPSYFKRWDLFKEITRYRFLFEQMITQWPTSVDNIRVMWNMELQKLDDDINRGIMDILWGKIDL